MTDYRTDETAELRRTVEDLTLKLDRTDTELRHESKERLKHAARADAAQAELDRIKLGGVPREKLVLAAQQGFTFALYTTGFMNVALVCLFFLSLIFSASNCGTPSEFNAENATGIVTDRYHYETRHYTTCSGRPSHCTTHTIPEHWTLRIAHDGHERETRVNEETWQNTAVGAAWCESPPCAPILTVEER